MIKSIGLLMVAYCIMLISCADNETKETSGISSEKPSDVFYVRTSPISISGLDDVIHVTGVIQSDTEAKPSFKTGGVIARTYVAEGDVVRKGQLLAQLNMTEIEAQATQAQFAVDKSRRDLQRVENLYRDSIATLEQYQNAGTAVEMAEKSLQIAEFNVAYSQIHSPIEGKVIKKLMQEGEITGPGVPVYYIMGVKQSDWKLVAGLTDKNWGKIKKGEKAKITLDAYPGWIIDSEVKRLADVANPLSGTLDVELSVPVKDKRIAAGMLAHIEILPSVKNEYSIIPIEALVSSNGRTGIVYVPKDGIAEKRTVMIQQFEGERVAIQSGLEGATEVITAGSGFLEDGDRISIEKE
jgi:multidrug efflux system membrane fusion protein